jgi:predicted O-methyltransferase YrrM
MSGKLNITNPAIHEYLEQIRPPSDAVLQEMEALARKRDFPCLGAQCSRILYALVKISKARRIFEMGSGFGYTMYWMAKAMDDGGMVIGTDNDAGNVKDAKAFFQRGGVAAKTDIRLGDAIELFTAEPGPFDMIFCDIDKKQYARAFALAKERLCPGGIFAADNLLRDGNVLSPDKDDIATKGILEFTRLIYIDPSFFSVVIPIRDGMSISIKTG